MKELQKRIDEYYQKENWPYWNQHEILARLTEEVGELAREINHQYGPKKKKSDEAANTIEAEVGDILYALACLANSENFSLQEALEKSINKVETRDKGRFTQKDS
jgi:NTP pyrophosphatase (non-canonical NTP hydrolase)